jgi:hypothetical protein
MTRAHLGMELEWLARRRVLGFFLAGELAAGFVESDELSRSFLGLSEAARAGVSDLARLGLALASAAIFATLLWHCHWDAATRPTPAGRPSRLLPRLDPARGAIAPGGLPGLPGLPGSHLGAPAEAGCAAARLARPLTAPRRPR